MKFGVIGPTAVSRSLAVSQERTVNLCPHLVETPNAKTQIVLMGTPGLKTFTTLPDSPVRAIHETNGTVLVAAGSHLYSLNQAGTYAELGHIAAGTDPVSIASNGLEFFITSQHQGYLWSGGVLTSAGPAAPAQVVFCDGYFITFDWDTQSFYISGLYDGATWGGLEFAKAEVDPDDIVSMLVDHRELWMFGSKSAEVFVNTGNSDFPFERVPGASIEQGCIATWASVKQDNSVFWLGGDNRGAGIYWRANGYTPVRVSTSAEEFAWSQYSKVDDAEAFPYTEEGHAHIRLRFPTAFVRTYPHTTVTVGATWDLDCSTNLWHEVGYWDRALGDYRDHLARCHCYVWGKHLVGDRGAGIIYEMSLNYHDDTGDPLRWMRITPAMSASGKRLFFGRVVLDMETGVGLTSGQGSDPQIAMQFSDDGGNTWSNEKWKPMGKIGEYKRRVIWNRQGSSFNRSYKFFGSDPVLTAIVDGEVEASVLK